MTYRGHVKNGQIALDESTQLPEGAEVSVKLLTQSGRKAPPNHSRREILQMPLEQRRQVLARQAARLIELYPPDPERDQWQGGDILE